MVVIRLARGGAKKRPYLQRGGGRFAQPPRRPLHRARRLLQPDRHGERRGPAPIRSIASAIGRSAVRSCRTPSPAPEAVAKVAAPARHRRPPRSDCPAATDTRVAGAVTGSATVETPDIVVMGRDRRPVRRQGLAQGRADDGRSVKRCLRIGSGGFVRRSRGRLAGAMRMMDGPGHGAALLVQLEGLANREAAAFARRVGVGVPRSALPAGRRRRVSTGPILSGLRRDESARPRAWAWSPRSRISARTRCCGS